MKQARLGHMAILIVVAVSATARAYDYGWDPSKATSYLGGSYYAELAQDPVSLGGGAYEYVVDYYNVDGLYPGTSFEFWGFDNDQILNLESNVPGFAPDDRVIMQCWDGFNTNVTDTQMQPSHDNDGDGTWNVTGYSWSMANTWHAPSEYGYGNYGGDCHTNTHTVQVFDKGDPYAGNGWYNTPSPGDVARDDVIPVWNPPPGVSMGPTGLSFTTRIVTTETFGDGPGDSPIPTWTPWNDPVATQILGDWDVAPEPPPVQKVVLAWDSVPVVLGDGIIIDKQPVPVEVPIELCTVQFDREAVMAEVRDIFARSGITNIEVTDTPSFGATTVYFLNSVLGVSGGIGFDIVDFDIVDGVPVPVPDQFNSHAEGMAVVFVDPSWTEERLASLVAHEAGHTFGLRHVNPGAADDPYNQQVMDYDFTHNPERPEKFINATTTIWDYYDDLLGVTHNPLYHLERYVDGHSHEYLVSQGIEPGSWDIPGGVPQELLAQLGFSSSAMVLYDVSVFSRKPSSEVLSLLAHFDYISLEELAGLEWLLTDGDILSVVGASAPGGDWDVVLAAGDPYDVNGAAVRIGEGEITAELQLLSDMPGDYTTLSDVLVVGQEVPEPATMSLLGLGGLALLRRKK